MTRPVRELRGFRKIQPKSGESRGGGLLDRGKELSFLRDDMTADTEPGKFQVFIGPNSRATRAASFELVKEWESQLKP